jgi:ATP-dependent helicase HrpA
MILEAESNGCLREVLVITAALSIQDPRERPLEHQQAADEKHARFRDPDSDFTTYLNLWRHLQEQQRALSSSQFRRLCRTEFLNYLRVREWQDLESQLRQVVKGMGVPVSGGDLPASSEMDAARVHTSLLAGLLSHLGMKDLEKAEYVGARGARFSIFPGSTLFRKNPSWVMAAELVETSRLWGTHRGPDRAGLGRTAGRAPGQAPVQRAALGGQPGSVMASEKVTLYGLPIVAARKVHYGRIDPVLSRELFLRHALVEGDWKTRHEFFHANRALLDEVSELEHRARRRDIVVDDEALFAFYDARVGAEVVSGRHFDSWWKRVRQSDPDLLTFEKAMLLAPGAGRIDRAQYPDTWNDLSLTYQFEPGAAADGVTVHIPLPLLQQVTGDGFDWQIPGLRGDLVIALLRSLPKAVRRNFVPVPDYAAALLDRLPAGPSGKTLTDELGEHLRRLTGVAVDRRDWAPDQGARPPAYHVPGGGRVRRRGGRGQGPDRPAAPTRPGRPGRGGGGDRGPGA